MIDRFRLAGTLVLGLMLALIVGMAVPHLTPYLPGSDSIFAAPTADTTSQPVQATEAVVVDWSSAVEISATEFEQHMANISHHNDVPEPYPAFKLKPRSERDNGATSKPKGRVICEDGPSGRKADHTL